MFIYFMIQGISRLTQSRSLWLEPDGHLIQNISCNSTGLGMCVCETVVPSCVGVSFGWAALGMDVVYIHIARRPSLFLMNCKAQPR